MFAVGEATPFANTPVGTVVATFEFRIQIWHFVAYRKTKSTPKMTTISQTMFTESDCIGIKILLKFVPKGPVDNNPALIQTMAWCQIGDKPFSEQMLIRFTDAYMRH